MGFTRRQVMPLRCNIVRSVPVDSGERNDYNAPVLKEEPQAVEGATDLACSMPTEDRRFNQQVEFRDNVSVYMMRVPLGVEICIGDRVQSIRNQADTEVFPELEVLKPGARRRFHQEITLRRVTS